jgi:signal-transduction protein with cAMP-binding, CBS, and nucleotidyltransferase domain
MYGTPAPTHPLVRIRSSATIREAAQLMCDMSMGALGVDDANHQFLGIYTERDVMWNVAQGRDHSTPLSEVLNDLPVIVEGPLTSLEAAIHMLDAHVRHLIVREGDQLRIVSTRDLVREDVAKGGEASLSHTEMAHMFGGVR